MSLLLLVVWQWVMPGLNIGKLALALRKTGKQTLVMKVNIDYLLHFDTNTTLPNRLLFREQFEHSLPSAEEGQQLNLLPVLLLELEDTGFEYTRLGNHYRELMLKELGQNLLKHVWGIINVTRISLTRFAILLSSPEPEHTTVDM